MKNVYIKCLLLVLATFSFAACSDDVLPNTSKPAVSLNEPSDVTRNTATISGSINTNGASVKECAFMYSTAQEALSVSSTTANKIRLDATDGSVSTTLTGLTAGTDYYYCLYVSSGMSSMISDIKKITTVAIAPPTLGSVEVVGTENYTFTVKSTLMADGGDAVTEVGFEYKKKGTADEYTSNKVSDFVPGGDNTFSLTIRNLQAGTEYEVRAYARNSLQTGYSETKVTTTEALLAPTVTTMKIVEENVGATWITVAGIIEDYGASDIAIEKGFCYSSTDQNPTILTDHIEVGGETAISKPFSTTIQGLKSNTTYYIRAYALNQVEGVTLEGYGDVVVINTCEITDDDKPDISSVGYSTPTARSIKINANVTTSKAFPITETGVCWTTNPDDYFQLAYQSGNMKTTEWQETGDYNAEILLDDLQIGQTYYIYFYAVNDAGLSWWNFKMEFTPVYEAPTIKINKTAIKSGVWMAEGSVASDDTPITEVGACWTVNELDDFDRAYNTNKKEIELAANNTFNVEINLTPGVIYWLWIYARNEGGFNMKYYKIELFIPGVNDNVLPDKE